MPALTNPKHERFAQLLAKGETATEAYIQAGYAPNDGNAARLKGNDRIAARVAEIQERAAVRTEITVASITDRLLAIAVKGEGSSEPALLSVARASLMDAAKLNGLIVDRSEVGKPGDFERMTDDELARYVATETAALGSGHPGTEATDDQAGVRSEPGGLH